MLSFQSRNEDLHEDEGEHSYLASSADLMVGLLFVFIIMVAFLALQNKVDEEPPPVAPAVVAPVVQKPPPKINSPVDIVTSRIGLELSKSLPGVTVNPSTGVITLPEGALFDLGSSNLKDSAVVELNDASKRLSEVLKCYVSNQRKNLLCRQNPEGHEIDTIFIEGHTDSRPMNRPGGNIKLSLDRAISVNNALMQSGSLSQFRNQLDQPLISYSAYADTRPFVKEDPSDGRNRRVDLRIVLAYKPPALNTALDAAAGALR